MHMKFAILRSTILISILIVAESGTLVLASTPLKWTKQYGSHVEPEFVLPIGNLTVAVNRDVTFRCFVQHLGGYKIGWVKADTKAIQSIHDHVITHNPRVSVTHVDQSSWNLHIRNVHEEDRGKYMCQINTDPMKSQMGHLRVVVPPDFIDDETSSDTDIPEGSSLKLVCNAKGNPKPRLEWKRENGKPIVIRNSDGSVTKVPSYIGKVLHLPKVTRSDMGPYMCIASNGVPPSISKRMMVTINFRPVVQAPNQLVGTPMGTNVLLLCHVEACPTSINYWIKEPFGMIIPSPKYNIQLIETSYFEETMTIDVRNLEKEDAGTYRCVAKNSLGEAESTIRLYEIPKSTGPYGENEDDYIDQTGSGERFGGANSHSIGDRGRTFIKNTGSARRHRKNHVPVDAASNSSKRSRFQITFLSQIFLLLVVICQIVYLDETW